jgi:hypothetical protein
MHVVAKFQCHQNSGTADPEASKSAHIKLGAVWEGTTEKQQASENAIFGKASPWGSIEIGIMNPPAAEFFKTGKKYYVTFTEAPD